MYPLKILGKLQRCVALWISSTFKMALTAGIEAIAGLISIHLYLQKLSGRSQLRAYFLPDNHILHLLMDNNPNSSSSSHPMSLGLLTGRYCNLIKGYLVDMENQFNEVFRPPQL